MSQGITEAQKTLLKQLKEPFDPKFVKWRVGATNTDKTKGIALAYIDSREVMKRLDDVCGIANWQDRYIPVEKGFICELDINIEGQWVTRSNAAGHTQVEAIKGGASDALKRAAATWGVGRYLYYLPNVWVPIKPAGKSYALAEIPELPSWAIPGADMERWEDVAELEAAANSGADDLNVDLIIDSVDKIRDAKNAAQLELIVNELEPAEKVVLANQIAAKHRELLHDEEVNSDSSPSTPTK